MPKKKTGTTKNNQPARWQPNSRLPLLATLLDRMLTSADEQYQMLQLARQRSHALDNDNIGRVITVFTTRQEILGLYDEQVKRWRAETLTDTQRGDFERLARHLQRLHTVIAAVLTLANELKTRTIEKVLTRSEKKLSLERCWACSKKKKRRMRHVLRSGRSTGHEGRRSRRSIPDLSSFQ